MGKIVVTENAALDGVIEQVGDWFAPAGDADADDSDVVATLREEMDTQAALLLGRKAFEDFRGPRPTTRQVSLLTSTVCPSTFYPPLSSGQGGRTRRFYAENWLTRFGI